MNIEYVEVTLKVPIAAEFTDKPLWFIFDPKQMIRPDPYVLSGMVQGFWLSREEAEEFLDRHRYRFSKRAIVFCMSCGDSEYGRLVKEAIERKIYGS